MLQDIQEVYDGFLQDILFKLGGEAHRNIAYSVVDVRDPDQRVEGCIVTEGATETARIDVRLSRKHQVRPTRFMLQALTKDLSPESGFNGFVANGRLLDPTGIEMLGRANRYNMPTWDRRLALDGSNC